MANLLTGLRLLLAVPAALAFAQPEFMSAPLLLALMILAIATDFLDGIVAGRRGTASPRGQLFDHTSDFLFVTSGLAGAAIAGRVTAALPILIVVAFSQYVLDSYLLHREKRLRMSFLGRWNGIFYFVPLVLIAVSRFDFGAGVVEGLSTLIVGLSYLLLFTTVASIVDRAVAPRRARAMSDSPSRYGIT
ncbi:MAG: CDP-alcohol phosphatidyltransferase family protein [Gemmatimonadetes bacterium]|nr:CDP-alcohol phosphatidyltransferase family protein [Gemmatimonadota bacterium]